MKRFDRKGWEINYRKTHRELKRRINKKYALNNPWMIVYSNAKQRCTNPNDSQYKNYGMRGIKFLLTKEEIKSIWLRDKAHLLKRPSIDRIDNDGNYCLENCRFIELSANVAERNTRIAKTIRMLLN